MTDPGLAKLPVIERVLGLLREAGLEPGLFADVRPNPVAANVEAGVAALRAGGHDGVVAVGGGSGLDTGKCVAFMAGQTRPMWDFEDKGDWYKRADPAGIRPIVAVPTTAGTGSEVGRAGVITDEATHTKKIIFHPLMMPKTAILDPELTVGLPRHLTAATGMDALAHCLEAYCAPTYHPMAEGIAVEGVRLVLEALPRACADGQDIAARGMMLTASSMGAVAFQKGLGAIHSLSHPVGSVYDTHHGLTNAVFMPYVLAFNRPAIEDKIDAPRRLARPAGARLPGLHAPRPGAARGDRHSPHAASPGRPRRPLRRARRHGGPGPDGRRQPGAVRHRPGAADVRGRLGGARSVALGVTGSPRGPPAPQGRQ